MTLRKTSALLASAAALLTIALTGSASAATPRWLAPQDLGDARQGQSPIAASDAKGRGIVAYIANLGDGTGQVLARRFTQKDGPQGSIVDLSGVVPLPAPDFALNRVDAVASPNGTATVAWRENDGKVLARRVSTSGAAGPVLELTPAGTANFGGGIYASAASDDAVAVTWIHAPGGGFAGRPQIRRIAPDGSLGPIVDLTTPSAFDVSSPRSITADSKGRFWTLIATSFDTDTTDPFTDAGYEARRLDADGSTVGPLVTLDKLGGVPTSSCAGEIKAAADDRIVASWSMLGSGPEQGIRARSIGSDGSLGPIAVVDPSMCVGTDVALTSDGTAFVEWTRRPAGSTTGNEHVVRSVTAEGKLGAVQVLESGAGITDLAYAELAPGGAGSVQALYVGNAGALSSRGVTANSALGPAQQLVPGANLQPFITPTGINGFAGAWVASTGLKVQLARTVSTAKPPSAKLQVGGDDSGRPGLVAKITTKAAKKDPLAAESIVSLTLPAQLAWTGKATKLVTVKADGKNVGAVGLVIKGRTLTITTQAGAGVLAITTKGGALTATKSLRCPSSVKPGKTCVLTLGFSLAATDVSGEKTSAKPTAKVRILA